jgi:hypothetical protein
VVEGIFVTFVSGSPHFSAPAVGKGVHLPFINKTTLTEKVRNETLEMKLSVPCISLPCISLYFFSLSQPDWLAPFQATDPGKEPSGSCAVFLIFLWKLSLHQSFFTSDIPMPYWMKQKCPKDVNPIIEQHSQTEIGAG